MCEKVVNNGSGLELLFLSKCSLCVFMLVCSPCYLDSMWNYAEFTARSGTEREERRRYFIGCKNGSVIYVDHYSKGN